MLSHCSIEIVLEIYKVWESSFLIVIIFVKLFIGVLVKSAHYSKDW